MVLAALICILILLIVWVYCTRNKFTVIKFYRETCGACKLVSDEWRKFELKRFFSNYTTKAYDLDLPSNAELAKKYNIKHVPMFYVEKKDGMLQIPHHVGRKASSWKEWLDQL